jgi:hypothetical protein
MGYTHSWTPTHTFSCFEFDRLRSAVKQIIATAALEPWSTGIELQRDDADEIWLNGSPLNGQAEDDVCHETFCLGRLHTSFQFCKTAQKPYDTVVVACLIAAQVIALEAGFSMKLSSDGDEDDWRDGFALYEATFPGRISQYGIYVGEILFHQASIYQVDLGYCANQSVPTASLEQNPEDPDALGSGDVPVPGSLRVWWIHSMASDETYYESVSSLEEGRRVLFTLANFDKFLLSTFFDKFFLSTFSSHGGLQEFVGLDGEFDEDEPEDTQGWIDATDRITPF